MFLTQSPIRQMVRSWFGAGNAPTTRRNTRRPSLEVLEDRCTPTVTVALTPATDSGIPGDFITNQSPVLTGTVDNPNAVLIKVFDAQNNQLMDNNAPVQAIVDQQGNWTYTFQDAANTLQEGVNNLTLGAFDNTDTFIPNEGAQLALNIDTTPPATPSVPVLDPASDTGVQGDNITTLRTLKFNGTGVAGEFVFIKNAANIELGTNQVDNNGNWTITTTLAIGTHQIRAEQRDAAGNINAVDSAPRAITVQGPAVTPRPITPLKKFVFYNVAVITKKIGAKKVLFVQIASTDGSPIRKLRCPFQKTAFKNITATAADIDNDGSSDGFQVLGKKITNAKPATLYVPA